MGTHYLARWPSWVPEAFHHTSPLSGFDDPLLSCLAIVLVVQPMRQRSNRHGNRRYPPN
jgi:hypothetical protein